MKKIEIIAYKLADGSFVNTDDVATGDLVRGAESLYTLEALEAAVNAAVANCELVTGARFTVDTATIINQLTGE